MGSRGEAPGLIITMQRLFFNTSFVKVDAEGDERGTEVMKIARPGGLGDIADLGLTLAEAFYMDSNEIAQATPSRLPRGIIENVNRGFWVTPPVLRQFPRYVGFHHHGLRSNVVVSEK